MADFEAMAERDIVCVFPDGRRQRVRLGVGRPRPGLDSDWECPIRADGLVADLAAMPGVDSWSALVLAVRFLEGLLTAEVGRGTVLHWEDEGTSVSVPVTVPELFAENLLAVVR